MLGDRITHLGVPGSGQHTKMVNQILIATNMIGVCEALTLASGSGLDLAVMLEVVTAGAAGSWALENLGPKIAAGELEPAFMIRLIQKDLAIVMDAAKKHALPLPGTALAVQLFRAVEAEEGGALGTQAMIKAYEKLAGAKIGG